MDERLRYILDLLEDEEISDEKFVADARSIGIGDFELAQLLVDEFSEEICTAPNRWQRQFCADAGFYGCATGTSYDNKVQAFDAAMAVVAYRFDLTLPAGSGRCRQAA